MLVYAKLPMGYTTIGNKRVYGRFFCYGKFGPTDIPYDVFIKHQEQLEEVEYTSDMLKEMFGTEFPPISLRLSKIKELDFRILVEIARAVGIDYHPGRGNRKPTLQERRALRSSVLSRITQ